MGKLLECHPSGRFPDGNARQDIPGRAGTQTGDLDATDYLARNDAYRFFQPLDALLVTGPTHTNVSDVRVLVVDRVEAPPPVAAGARMQ